MPERSPTFSFYLIINPGLEDLALDELKLVLPQATKIQKTIGGIEFDSDLDEGLELNALLKIPTRILLRLDEFAATDFPKLFKKLQKIGWSDLLYPDTPLKFEVSSEKSRIVIKKRIGETAREAIGASLKETKTYGKRLPEQKIFLRVIDDIFTVSIDTSGERLHKRGYRSFIGEAPLRENLAAALLGALFKNVNSESLTLIDPTLGSGTFLLEAYSYFAPSNKRGYAFERWPLAKKIQPKRLAVPAHIAKIQTLVGYDQDADAIKAALENFKSLKKLEKPNLIIEQKDLFKSEFSKTDGTRILIANPPYGKRIKVQGNLSEYYSKMLVACFEKFEPIRAGFLFSDAAGEVKTPPRTKLVEQIKFRNGGFKVRFAVYDRR